MSDFMLHSQLARDTIPIGSLVLSRLLLMNDSRFPWVILVPKRPKMKELIDLSLEDQALLLAEINTICRTMQTGFTPDKLNVAALGNMVPQLHVHIIARFKTDEAWPKPVWGVGLMKPYSDTEIENVKKKFAAIF